MSAGRGGRSGRLVLVGITVAVVALFLAIRLGGRGRAPVIPTAGPGSGGPLASKPTVPSPDPSFFSGFDRRVAKKRFSSPLAAWQLLQREPRPAIAVAYFMEQSQANPKDADLQAYLGWACVYSGSLEQGRQALDKALELNPSCALAHLFHGDLAVAEGNLDKARESYHKALTLAEAGSLTGPLAAALHREGSVLLWKGDLKGAKERYDRAFELTKTPDLAVMQPRIIAAQALVAELSDDAGNALRLLEEWQKVAQGTAQEGEVAGPRLAYYLLKSKQYDKAEAVLKDALANGSINNVTARLLLVACYLQSGKKGEARRLAIPLLRNRSRPDALAQAWKQLHDVKP